MQLCHGQDVAVRCTLLLLPNDPLCLAIRVTECFLHQCPFLTIKCNQRSPCTIDVAFSNLVRVFEKRCS